MSYKFHLMKCKRYSISDLYGSGGILQNVLNFQHQLVALDLLFVATALPPTATWTAGRLALVAGLGKSLLSHRKSNRGCLVVRLLE